MSHVRVSAALRPRASPMLLPSRAPIDGAPDTMLVDAEIVAIIEEQQRWVTQHLAGRWAPGVTPTYLFLAAKMNRHADRHYTYEGIVKLLDALLHCGVR